MLKSAKAHPDGKAEDRWHGRPVLAALVSFMVFVIPIVVSIGAAMLTAHLLPRPHSTGWLVGWWATVLGVPTAVVLVTERLARRALPLAVLLKMTMVFPDRAPKRLAVARKAGSTRDLVRRVEQAKTQGIEDEPVVAAEKILSLAGALNAHDRLTRGHGERVRAFTDLIADALDLPADDRDRLRWSALLHDIGKLAVHPHILNKPDKLDDDEWVLMKNHPLEGAKLTAPLAGWLGPWAKTIAEHHEKFDGTGYPYGLSGDEISLGGRIVAVADCYDTMTAVRSYKRAMSPEAARAELAACAGSHFDPQVVRAFLDVSIGRLRPVAGPLAWLGSVPFVDNIPRLGQAVSTAGRVGTASVMVAGAVTAGTLQTTSQTTAMPHGHHVAASTGSPHGVDGKKATNIGAGGRSDGNTTLPTGSTTTGKASGPLSGTGRNGSSPSGSSDGGSGSGVSGDGNSGPTTTVLATVPGPRPSVPLAPTGVHAMAGNGQVSVSWSAPNENGSTIVSYTVTPSIGGATQTPHTFLSSSTTDVVSGLTNGVTYTFTVTATNAVGSGPPSAASPGVTPIAASLTIKNGGGQAGRSQLGDQIVLTFSPAPSPNSFCAGWTGTSFPNLKDPNVVVQGNQPTTGNDTITLSDATDCTGGFHFGSIDLGQRGYFNNVTTFGGSSGTCSGGTTTGCSSVHWDGLNTLTITLGQESTGQPTQGSLSVAVYTPDPVLGYPGTISSTKEENF